jgi:hypothetical protein
VPKQRKVIAQSSGRMILFIDDNEEGEPFVAELRKFDPLVQAILQTGYASRKMAA